MTHPTWEFDARTEVTAGRLSVNGARYIAHLERERGEAQDALRALWDDIRDVDKRFVPNDVVGKVKAVLDA